MLTRERVAGYGIVLVPVEETSKEFKISECLCILAQNRGRGYCFRVTEENMLEEIAKYHRKHKELELKGFLGYVLKVGNRGGGFMYLGRGGRIPQPVKEKWENPRVILRAEVE